MRLTWAKLMILAALLCLWGVIALVRWPSTPPLSPSGVLTDVKGARTPDGKLGSLPRLKTELLTIPYEPYPPQAANMFTAPPPPPPSAEANRTVMPPPSAPPPDLFAEAARQLHFQGFLQSDATTTAFITRGADLFIAAIGDTVAERFRVVSVQEDAVTLASREGDKQVRLALAAAGAPGTSSIQAPSPVGVSSGWTGPTPIQQAPSPLAASSPLQGGVTQAESTGETLAQNEAASPIPDPFTAAVLRERAERADRIGSRTRMLPQ